MLASTISLLYNENMELLNARRYMEYDPYTSSPLDYSRFEFPCRFIRG